MIVEKMIAVTLKLFYPIPFLIFLKALILTNWDVSFNCFIIYIMIQFWLFSSFSTALKKKNKIKRVDFMLFNPCDICKENSSEQKESFNKKVIIVRSLRLKK